MSRNTGKLLEDITNFMNSTFKSIYKYSERYAVDVDTENNRIKLFYINNKGNLYDLIRADPKGVILTTLYTNLLKYINRYDKYVIKLKVVVNVDKVATVFMYTGFTIELIREVKDPNLLDMLDSDVLGNIFKFLDNNEVIYMRTTCKNNQKLFCDNIYWIDKFIFNNEYIKTVAPIVKIIDNTFTYEDLYRHYIKYGLTINKYDDNAYNEYYTDKSYLKYVECMTQFEVYSYMQVSEFIMKFSSYRSGNLDRSDKMLAILIKKYNYELLKNISERGPQRKHFNKICGSCISTSDFEEWVKRS
jgi:hypothetical protein